MKKQIIVIGGGAAGFFAAINVALLHPRHQVLILEKTNKLLSKVKVSGGGRCNVTHHCFENSELIKNYPRGGKELQQVFSRFSVSHTIAWFKSHGIELKTEADGRMFPQSNSSQTIIDCFMHLAQQLNIQINLQCEVLSLKKENNTWGVVTSGLSYKADAVICAMGGNSKDKFYQILKDLGHQIESPIPSLFTFNLPGDPITKELQGLSVADAEVRIKNSKLNYHGPLLITHWGLSGPAVLKLSAFAAKDFYPINYETEILINWLYPLKLHDIEGKLRDLQKEKHKTHPLSHPQFDLPKRLWEYLCLKAGLSNHKPWAEVSKFHLQQLAQQLGHSSFHMSGRTTFKEEFVTCGGVNLKEVDFKTMQSKVVPGLYFCGEILNIDGITGGFNFQSAWSTAWLAAQNCAG